MTFSLYGTLISIGILACIYTVEKLSPVSKKHLVWKGAPWVIVGGILGARLYHVVSALPYYTHYPLEIVKIWQGGLGILGGLFGGFISLYIFLRAHNEVLKDWMGLISVAVPMGQAIGRWGNFFNHELFGLPTNLPWGVVINPQYRPNQYANVSIFHPLFLYESILCLGLFWFLYKKYKTLSENHKWLCFIYYVRGYATIRFFLEFLRIPGPDVWLIYGFNVAQVIALVILIFSYILQHKNLGILKA